MTVLDNSRKTTPRPHRYTLPVVHELVGATMSREVYRPPLSAAPVHETPIAEDKARIMGNVIYLADHRPRPPHLPPADAGAAPQPPVPLRAVSGF